MYLNDFMVSVTQNCFLALFTHHAFHFDIEHLFFIRLGMISESGVVRNWTSSTYG